VGASLQDRDFHSYLQNKSTLKTLACQTGAAQQHFQLAGALCELPARGKTLA
jgi:hypothetical protein